VKPFRLLLAVIGILMAGVLLGNVAIELTGMPDLFGILSWSTLFVALSGAAAYSALRGS